MSNSRHIPASHSVCRSSRPAAAAAAVLLSSLFLSGCASFSPDAGMGVVAGVAGQSIRRDVMAGGTEDPARAAAGRGVPAPRPAKRRTHPSSQGGR